MPRNLSSSPFMRPFVVLALPGMYLFYKYSQYKRQQQEQNRRKVTERELAHLNHKIDKLLSKLEENEPEMATSQEDECVICVNAKATMQTSPCGHCVVCRKCFVKTIQMAVSQRLLPLRCVICRAKILRLKQTLPHKTWLLPASASAYAMGGKAWVVPSASQYSMAVPNSESLYSMASGSSSLSGVSSVSSATNSSSGSHSEKYRYPRQPISGSLRKSQTQSMKYRLQEYKEPVRGEPQEKPRLPPIQEFQREFRAGKERSASTRIRCAQKIVTQLETTPLVSNTNKTYFRSPLKPPNKEVERKKLPADCQKQRVKEERLKVDVKCDNKKHSEDIIEQAPSTSSKDDKSKKCEKKDKKEEKKESKKDNKPEKEEKKELTKAEKKEIKKEAKAEKKNAKKEAKLEAKKEKIEKKEKNEKKEKIDKKEKSEKKDKKEENAKK